MENIEKIKFGKYYINLDQNFEIIKTDGDRISSDNLFFEFAKNFFKEYDTIISDNNGEIINNKHIGEKIKLLKFEKKFEYNDLKFKNSNLYFCKFDSYDNLINFVDYLKYKEINEIKIHTILEDIQKFKSV